MNLYGFGIGFFGVIACILIGRFISKYFWRNDDKNNND